MGKEQSGFRYGPIRRTVAAGVTTLGVLGMLNSDSTPSTPTNHHRPLVVQFMPGDPMQNSFYQQQKGPCDMSSSMTGQQELKKAEEACVASERGTVAVVNFAEPKKEVAQVVKEMKLMIREGSGGEVAPKVVVVDATPQAREALDRVEEGHNGCIDTNANVLQSASFIAGYTMQQQLRHMDYVMAISSENACAKEGGQADTQSDKFADLYVSSDRMKPGINTIVGMDGAHELFHLLGLGHAGTYWGKDTNGIYSSLELYPSPTPFKLDQFLTGGDDKEYGENLNVMGGYTPVTKIMDNGGVSYQPSIPAQPNHLQSEVLREPMRELTGDILGEKKLGKEPLTITLEEAKKGRFAMTHLDKLVVLTDPDTGNSYEFENLAAVPLYDEENGLFGTALYLVDFSGYQLTTVNLGIAYPNTEPIQMTFHDQVITLQKQNNTLMLHAGKK